MKLRQRFLYMVVGSWMAVLFTVALTPEAEAANPISKAARGLKNIIIAPAEIPVSIADEGKKNPFQGLIIGPVAGAVNCVTRVAAGVVELIVSPMPPYDRPLYDKGLGETIWE